MLHPGAKGGTQGVGYVVVGLKAAGADARADGSADVFRSGSEEADHLTRRLGGQVQSGAPPAGVDSADALGNGVVEEDDDAVGGEDHQI